MTGYTGGFKTGEVKTGEGETEQVIASPTQTFTMRGGRPITGEQPTGQVRTGGGPLDPAHDITGEAEADPVTSPVQTYSVDHPTASMQYQLPAPTQTFGLTSPTPDPTGAGEADPVASPVQTFALDGPGNIGFAKWNIDGTELNVTGVRLTPEELTLDVRARSSIAQSLLDDLDSNAGAYDTRELADGTIQNRDTAGGANTYTVYPKVEMLPPRMVRDWLVDNVTRTRTSTDTEAISSTIALVPAETRDPVREYGDASDTSRWQFEFGANRIVTASVGDIEQGETSTVNIVLTDRQAELIESVTGAIGGAVTFVVPDGDTFTRDETPTDRQSVTITPPSSASDPAIPADTYVVAGWTSRGSDGSGFRLAMEISTRYE